MDSDGSCIACPLCRAALERIAPVHYLCPRCGHPFDILEVDDGECAVPIPPVLVVKDTGA